MKITVILLKFLIRKNIQEQKNINYNGKSLKFDDNIILSSRPEIIYSDKKSIYFKTHNDICIMSEKKIINNIKIDFNDDYLTSSMYIYNKFIYLYNNSDQKIYIYDLQGRLINSWKVKNEVKYMAVNNKEIFTSCNNLINVYSNRGELIRTWNNINFYYINYILINENIIYVCDQSKKYKNRIRGFTCDGQIIFSHIFKKNFVIGNFLILDDNLYIENRNNNTLEEYCMIY